MDLEKAFTLYLTFTLIVFSAAAFYYSENSNKLDECTNRLIEQKNKVYESVLDNKSCNRELMECGDELNKTFNGMFNLSREVQNLTKEKKIIESELKDIIKERDSYKTSLESISEFAECEVINQSLKDECLLDIIIWKKSLPEFIQLATCRIIQNQDMRDKCFTYTAIHQNNSGICAEISNKSFFYITLCTGNVIKHYYIDDCYLNLALKKRDTSLCEKINNIIQRNGCYAKVATLRDDYSICGKITDKEAGENCIEAIKSGGCGCKACK
ncbi:MAG: hypothetical protein U9M95_06900 [Candidatus Altiarchaeota archaeon]|nr:hypothetical protein [Candidatus Altiarchaeota archaeon]